MSSRPLLLLSLVAILTGVITAMPVAQDQPAIDLFLPAPSAAADLLAAASSRPDTVEARSVAVNPMVFDAGRLRIDLFGGESLVAERVALGPPASGRIWNGAVAGSPQSSVTLAEVEGSIQGSIRTLEAAYSIEPLASTGAYALRQVDPSLSRPELPPQQAAIPGAAADLSPVQTDNGTIFDVLVVYNQAARSFAGSDANVRARIELGIAEANTAYANSQIVPRLRLVGAEFVDYTQQPDMLTDLDRLTETADGFMDAVHSRRNVLGADLVHLVIGPQTNACGIGWLMQNLSAGFAANAFSVSAYDCISPNYTLAHELGHNMGSHHAPEDLQPGDTALYPYSFGFKNPDGLFRTVMAYNCDGGCPRVLNFSNPDVLRSGRPTGTVALHDNARSIDSARVTIANWRPAAGLEPPTISAIGPKATTEDTPGALVPFTIGDPDTAAGSLTVSASSSNPALVPNGPSTLVLGGAGTSRTLTVVPAANATGSTTITVSVSDGITVVPTSFALSVTPVNDAPAIAFEPPFASTPEGVHAEVIVTVSDIDSPGSSLALSATSGNTSLLPNSGIAIAAISSTAATRTFRATLSPAADGHGTATVSFVANDFGPAGTTVAAFPLTVLGRPTLAAIADRTIHEDGSATVPLTMSDPDTPVVELSVSATSSNLSLVGEHGLTISGTGASRTLRVRPNANAHGSTTITVAVSDGTQAAVRSFVLAVTPVNDAPVFHSMTVASVTAAAGVQTTFHVSVIDADSPPAALTLSGTSSDNALLPSIGIVPVETTATGRMFAVTLSPAPNVGTATLALTASDAQSAMVAREIAVGVVLTPVAPDPPLNLTAGATGTRITLHWFAAQTGAPATTYLVEIGASPGTTTLPTQATTAPTVSLAADLPDGMYFVRVRGVNGAGASAPSAEAFVAVGAAALLPGPPAHFTIDTFRTSATLGWTASAVGLPASSYVIEAGSAPGLANLVTLVTTGPATSFAVPAVPAGTYFVRVRGRNHVGVGAPSQDVSIVMGPSGQCRTLPGAPVLLTPVVNGNAVSLSWNAAATGGPAESYAIAAGGAPGLSDLARLDTGSSGTSFAASAPNGVYYVRVAASNPCGSGPASNEVSFTLGPERPRAPSGLQATVAPDRRVTLTWTPPVGGAAPTGYLVQAGSGAGLSNLAVISTGSALPAFTVVAPAGTYHVRVSALNGAGAGLPSNEIILVVP